MHFGIIIVLYCLLEFLLLYVSWKKIPTAFQNRLLLYLEYQIEYVLTLICEDVIGRRQQSNKNKVNCVKYGMYGVNIDQAVHITVIIYRLYFNSLVNRLNILILNAALRLTRSVTLQKYD